MIDHKITFGHSQLLSGSSLLYQNNPFTRILSINGRNLKGKELLVIREERVVHLRKEQKTIYHGISKGVWTIQLGPALIKPFDHSVIIVD